MSSFRFRLTPAVLWLGMMMNPVLAQVAVDVSKYGVQLYPSNENSVQLNSEKILSDVQIEGVAVINGDVFIDGEQVPKGKTSFTAKKSRKTYRIQWGANGNVSVSEK